MKPAEMPIAAAPGREIRLASGDDANRYMLGPHFEANPIGVEYDPDDVLKKIRSGTLGAAFQQRKSDLPASPIRGTLAH